MKQTVQVPAKIKVETVTTTPDRVKNVVQKYMKRGPKDWKAPFGFILTVLGVLCTSDFKIAFGIPKEYWGTLFIALLIGCSIWLVYVLIFNWYYSEQKLTDDMINAMKMESTGN